MNFKQYYLNETTRRQKLRQSLHNIRTRDLTMGIVSPENPMGEEASEAENRESRREFKSIIKGMELPFFKTKGKYGADETSYMIPGIGLDQLKQVAKKFDQQSFIFALRQENGRFAFQYWERDSVDDPYEKTKEETTVLNQQDEEDFYTILGDYKFKIPFKFEDRFLKKKKSQKTLKEGLLTEGTGNFDIDNRCVVVMFEPNEEFDEERKQEYLEENPDADEEEVEEYIEKLHEADAEFYYDDFQRYFDNADKPEGYFYEIKLKPGYYQGGSIDICEKGSWSSIGDELLGTILNDLSYREYDESKTMEEIVDEYVKEQDDYVYGITDEIRKKIVDEIVSRIQKSEDEDGDVEYEIKGYPDTDFCYEIDEILKEAEYNYMDRWLDKFADDHGLDDYAVSARFSNGETMYTKVNRKKTNESYRPRGRMLTEITGTFYTKPDIPEESKKFYYMLADIIDAYDRENEIGRSRIDKELKRAFGGKYCGGYYDLVDPKAREAVKEIMDELDSSLAETGREKILEIPARICRPVLKLGTFPRYCHDVPVIRFYEKNDGGWTSVGFFDKENFVKKGFGDEETYDRILSYLKRNVGRVWKKVVSVLHEKQDEIQSIAQTEEKRRKEERERYKIKCDNANKKVMNMPKTKGVAEKWVSEGGLCTYRYGFSFRGAKAHEIPTQKAEKILPGYSFGKGFYNLSWTVFNGEVALEFNELSENDMY